MSLRDEKLITLKEAAALTRLNESTLRKREAGTEGLTHVRMGSRVFLIKSEVEGLIKRRIDEARRYNYKLRGL